MHILVEREKSMNVTLMANLPSSSQYKKAPGLEQDQSSSAKSLN